MEELTAQNLRNSVYAFTQSIRETGIPELYGVTDGKAVGTFVEVLFNAYLQDRFKYLPGSAANGIDFPSLNIDLKVTSIRQPQSSCPFRAAEQKVYGLGYDLLVLVYDKIDIKETEMARLDFKHAVYVSKKRTGDYQTTRGILELLSRDANKDDLIAFFEERNLPLEEIGLNRLAEQVLLSAPEQGYLTISNALQWRLQYSRVITVASQGDILGVDDLFAESGNNL